ncbi:MAG: patatin-like phospholipase family protein [Pseudomonadota bacterium]
MRRLLWALCLLPLAACGGRLDEPDDLVCPLLPVVASEAPEVSQGTTMSGEEAQVFGMGAMFDQRAVEAFRAELERAERANRPAPLPRVDVAILSAGGQFGAFTAGFMKGWSENTVEPRPEAFDIVTGVSTGALLAPFVFAGSQYDDDLAAVYNGVDEREIFRRRSPLELISSPSLWDPAPLYEIIDSRLTPQFEQVLQEASAERTLLVGAVNLRTGFFEAFDITSSVKSPLASRRDCIREALLASAAIPVAFPPRRLNGEYYIDGATRQGVFLRGLATARVEPTIYIFLNNASGFPTEDVDYRLAPLAGRTTQILSDELLRASAIDTVQFAKDQGWRIRGVFVPDIWPDDSCVNDQGGKLSFCASFTSELYAAGRRIASGGRIPWLDADELIAELQRRRSIESQF